MRVEEGKRRVKIENEKRMEGRIREERKRRDTIKSKEIVKRRRKEERDNKDGRRWKSDIGKKEGRMRGKLGEVEMAGERVGRR